MRICIKCKKELSLIAFHRETRRKDGLQLWCRDCENEYRRYHYKNTITYRERVQRKNKIWHHNNKDGHNHSIRASELRRRYNLSWEDYQKMLDIGQCGLCGGMTPGGKGTWHIDHSHKTGIVRGLLCHNCNLWLGVYEIFIDKLGEKAIKDYLNTNKLLKLVENG